MPKHPSDPELKAEFSARIRQILEKETVQEIAEKLQVKRQMVYNYRDARNAPSQDVIRRALEAWPSLPLNYRGKVLILSDFERKPARTAKRALQYGLWDAIKKLDSDSVEIEILKKESASVQLGVRIYFRGN